MWERIQRLPDEVVGGIVIILVLLLLSIGIAFAQTQPSCEDQRDDLLQQSGAWQQAVGQLSKENRQLRAKIADLEKSLPKKEDKK